MKKVCQLTNRESALLMGVGNGSGYVFKCLLIFLAILNESLAVIQIVCQLKQIVVAT